MGEINAAWMVRAGRSGERAEAAIAEGLAIAGWVELGDLSEVKTRSELREVVRASYPDRGNTVIGNWTGQLWRFISRIQVGDLLVLPRNSDQIAIGTVTGAYEYRAAADPNLRHVRPVKWFRTDVSRADDVLPDLQNSMGSLLTVFGLKRHDAVRRIQHLAETGTDPGQDQSESGGGGPANRDELLDQAAKGEGEAPKLTIRQLLGLWNTGRRTVGTVAAIESDLADRGLTTVPPFTEGWIDNTIRLVPISTEPEPTDGPAAVEPSRDIPTADELPAVSLRVGDLESANSPVMGVDSEQSLDAAITLMLANDFSQLAVHDSAGGVRAVSWESVARASVAYPNVTLAHATVGARIVDYDADLLAQVDEIYEFGYVLVRGPDRVSITGIVTTADLTLQFASMARPIALIEEVERRLRRRADEAFTLEELRAGASSPNRIRSAADLMLGAYDNRLLATEESFRRMGWRLDHTLFLNSLTAVRRIRNELMHFSTDPLTPEQMQSIQGLVNMLRTVDPRA
ncbi:hypothetical protein AB0L70_38735 [Kribbella sp. NPDC051952]|uniref:restriction endonuclease n=1 Tax=Kribbella sp. NPDC051952 TaxID=3154851 RepID=UPI00341D0D73